MQKYHIQLVSLQDTVKFGEQLGLSALPGDVICLDGDLGAGKTTLTQAIASGLGVDHRCYVTSPSFAILHEYAGRISMYHMDFYRLQDAGEVLDLGLDEYFHMSGLTVIEWSSRAADILPKERLSIEILLNIDESRTLVLKSGAQLSQRIRALVSAYP